MILTKEDNLADLTWEASLQSLPDGGELLQSGIWRQIALAEKREVKRFSWLQEKGMVAVLAQVLTTNRFGLKSWYLPRGPVWLLSKGAEIAWPLVLADLIQEAKRQGVMSIRFEPENWPLPVVSFGQKITSIQPEKSLFLDLSYSEEELLSQMHPKTRYNIRLAEKKGVEIVSGQSEDLVDFWQLLQTTTARAGFRGHSLAHYRHLLEKGGGAIELYFARLEGKILAAGLFSFYGGRAVYLHGASANNDRQYMAPYLLQWRMIQRAKAKHCRYYDFYGIDEKRWPGVTRFKRGFGGEERVYPGSFLLVISKHKYFIYSLLSKIVKKLRP
ncbi:MAG TPA: peptidoglycan bridge formation glycyltransferase FemA/FemB family protein [bacterium]|nr:peptidoglycan bridge formation glycyltransferase FemA/FemB family protein [bacterium]HQQ38602.1 peptidoglycan bridge formation glycyltransferase FemA/FemB family protein [bacterium]